MTTSTEPTNTGGKLIEEWDTAVLRVKRAEEELERQKEVEAEARNALGKWLIPSDYKFGEMIGIGIWCGHSCYVAIPQKDGTIWVERHVRFTVKPE